MMFNFLLQTQNESSYPFYTKSVDVDSKFLQDGFFQSMYFTTTIGVGNEYFVKYMTEE